MKLHQKKLSSLALAIAAAYQGHAFAADAQRLAEVKVTAGQDSEWVAGSSSSATKTDTPLRDVPQSVQVVDKSLIQQQGAREMKDVLRNVSGVAVHQGEGRRDQFYIRGFTAERDTLVDGMRDDSQYFRDLGNVEAIEVVKGPAAVLYGRGSAGGVINRVTKKPTATAQAEAALTVGSENLRRVDADLGGPLSDTLRYRLTAAHEKTDSFRDVIHSERNAIAPAIAWAPSAATEVLLQAEFLRQHRTPDRGLPTQNGRPAEVPISNFYGELYDFADTDAASSVLRVDHRLSEQLSLSNAFRYSDLQLDASNTRHTGLINNNTQVRRNVTYFPQHQKNYLNQTEAVYKAQTGAVAHAVLAGVEFGYQSFDRQSRQGNIGPVDLQNPAHVLPRPELENLPFSGFTGANSMFHARTAGAYLQDQLTFSERWKALAGLRFDRFDQRQNDRQAGSTEQRIDHVWSPRVGVVYQPNAQHSLYASASRSFQPIGGDFLYITSNNKIGFADVKPLTTTLNEVGLKSDWLGGKLSSTVAVYDIAQKNRLTNDPSNPAGNTKIQNGEQQSRGFELDLAGNITAQWKVYGGYSLNQAQITRSNDSAIAVGNRPGNVPLHSGSLWSSYEFGNGFGVGAGAFYSGDRFADDDNTVTLPRYVRYDAALFYKAKRFEANLNLNNVTDKQYYEAATNNNQIGPGAPFNVVLTARMKFH